MRGGGGKKGNIYHFEMHNERGNSSVRVMYRNGRNCDDATKICGHNKK